MKGDLREQQWVGLLGRAGRRGAPGVAGSCPALASVFVPPTPVFLSACPPTLPAHLLARPQMKLMPMLATCYALDFAKNRLVEK